MLLLLISLGVLNIIFFRNNWKNLIYFFIIFLPYLGFVQNKIQAYTVFAPLIHDILFIIPIYFIFVLSEKEIFSIPRGLGNLIVIFAVLLLVQFVNPFNQLNIYAKLVSLKVWFFYFFFIFIGIRFVEDKVSLKKFCNVFAISAIIPCIVGILQYVLSLIFGYQETMILFFGNKEMAYAATQGFAGFQFGGIELIRIPSTFSYIGQYLNFLLISLLPAITSISLSNTKKERIIYSVIFLLIIVAILISGARGAPVFAIIFFIVFFIIHFEINPALKIFYLSIFLISGYIGYTKTIIVQEIFDLGVYYTTDYFFVDLGDRILRFFLGIGLGNATGAVRYVQAREISQMYQLSHESYYFKTLVELGFIGLILIFLLFFNYLYLINVVRKNLSNKKERILCSLLFAYTFLHIVTNFKTWVNFDGYPNNFLFFLFLGIVLKMGSKSFLKQSYP